MERIISKIGVISLILLTLSACGQPPKTEPEEKEEGCVGATCTEADINAPVPDGETEEVPVPTQPVDPLPTLPVPTPPVLPQTPPATEEPPPPPNREFRFPDFESSWGLKRAIFEKAVRYYEQVRLNLANQRYVTVIDFSQHSSQKRLYLFDLATGKVERYLTSHGKNSDPNNDGYATSFSNTPESKKSSLGFYLTLHTYTGKHVHSMRLRGLESSNSNAEKRAI